MIRVTMFPNINDTKVSKDSLLFRFVFDGNIHSILNVMFMFLTVSQIISTINDKVKLLSWKLSYCYTYCRKQLQMNTIAYLTYLINPLETGSFGDIGYIVFHDHQLAT